MSDYAKYEISFFRKFVLFLLILSSLYSLEAQLDLRSETPLIDVPELKTVEDQLSFLIWAQERIPKLFSDSVAYDFDLLKILEANSELLKKLSQNKEFVEAYRARKKLLRIDISPQSEAGAVRVRSVNQGIALNDWKLDLKLAAGTFSDSDLDKSFATSLSQLKQRALLPVEINAALGAFFSILRQKYPTKAKEFSEAIKSEDVKKLPLDKKIEILRGLLVKHNIHEEALVGVNYERAGFSAPLPESTSFTGLLDLIKQTYTMDTAMLSQVLQLQAIRQRKSIKDHTSLLKAIDALTWQDFELFHDKPDVMIPEGLRWGLDQREVEHIAEIVKNNHEQILEKNTCSEEQGIRKLSLVEVPPYLGIFRGCVSADCSTQFSFPYPNDPNERVFFVYGKDSTTPKGMVSATVVQAGKEKSLYVSTINGNISGSDTMSILHALDKEKAQFGVATLTLPRADALDGLVNNPNIRSVFLDQLKGGQSLPIRYLNPGIRKTIQDVEVHNSAEYDHMDSNSSGVAFRPSSAYFRSISTQSKAESIPAVKLAPISKTSAFYLALDMQSDDREDVQLKLLEKGEINPKEFSELEKLFENNEKLNVSEYMNRLIESARAILGASFDEKEFLAKKHLFSVGRLKAPDCLADGNLRDTMRILREEIRGEIDDDVKPNVDIKFLIEHREQLKKDAEFRKMMSDYLRTRMAAFEKGDNHSNLFIGVNDLGHLAMATADEEVLKSPEFARHLTLSFNSPPKDYQFVQIVRNVAIQIRLLQETVPDLVRKLRGQIDYRVSGDLDYQMTLLRRTHCTPTAHGMPEVVKLVGHMQNHEAARLLPELSKNTKTAFEEILQISDEASKLNDWIIHGPVSLWPYVARQIVLNPTEKSVRGAINSGHDLTALRTDLHSQLAKAAESGKLVYFDSVFKALVLIDPQNREKYEDEARALLPTLFTNVVKHGNFQDCWTVVGKPRDYEMYSSGEVSKVFEITKNQLIANGDFLSLTNSIYRDEHEGRVSLVSVHELEKSIENFIKKNNYPLSRYQVAEIENSTLGNIFLRANNYLELINKYRLFDTLSFHKVNYSTSFKKLKGVSYVVGDIIVSASNNHESLERESLTRIRNSDFQGRVLYENKDAILRALPTLVQNGDTQLITSLYSGVLFHMRAFVKGVIDVEFDSRMEAAFYESIREAKKSATYNADSLWKYIEESAIYLPDHLKKSLRSSAVVKRTTDALKRVVPLPVFLIKSCRALLGL